MVSSFNQVYENYGENNANLVVLGISLDANDNQQKLEKFKKANMGKYPEIEGTKYGAGIFSQYKGTLGSGYPSLCLISPKTKSVIWKFKGFKSYMELDKILMENGVKKDPTDISFYKSEKNNNQLSFIGVQNNRVTFSANDNATYSIVLLNLEGRKIASQVFKTQSNGLQTVTLSTGAIPKGAYIVNFIGTGYTFSKNITVFK